jgi:hypothetical protein
VCMGEWCRRPERKGEKLGGILCCLEVETELLDDLEEIRGYGSAY